MPDKKIDPPSLFQEFTDGLRSIPPNLATAAQSEAKASKSSEQQLIAQSFSNAFEATMTEIADILDDAARLGSKEQLVDAERLLKSMGAMTLINETKILSSSISIFGIKLSILQLIQFIKKIIQWLFDEIFNWSFGWLTKLLELINETLDALLGAGDARVTHALSLREQDYLNELAALARYEAARAMLSNNETFEDDI